MESTARLEMRIGLLVMAGFVTVVALILISDRVTLDDKYGIDVYLDDAGGLNIGSPVKLSGITIGQVEGIRTTTDRRGAILARISVNERFDIDRDSLLENQSSGIFGDNYLSFTPPPGGTGEYLSKDGNAAVIASTAFFDRATQQVQGVLDGLASVFDARGQQDIKRVLAGSADLVEESTLLVNQLRRHTNELDDMIANGNALIAELRETRATMGAELSNTLTETDNTLIAVRETTTRVGQDIHSLRDDAGRMLSSSASLLARGDSMLAASDQKIISALANLEAMSATLHRLLIDVEAGKGVVGQMMRSDELARDLNETAITANQVAERIADAPEILVWGSSEDERDAARVARERNKLRRAFMSGYGREVAIEKVADAVEIEDESTDQGITNETDGEASDE